MANQTCAVSDGGFTNIAALKNAALVGTEYGLAVRAIGSPANVSIVLNQLASVASGLAAATRLTAATAQTNRRTVKLKNGGAATIYLGPDSTTSVSSGYALLAGESEDFDVGPALAIYGISASSTNGPVYVMELG